MRVLGISAFYHDSAAALIDEGDVIAAAQEERFTRKKHDSSFPRNAVRYCLEEGGCALSELDYIVFYDKPFLKFERLLETYMAFAPKGFLSFKMSMPLWIKEKLFQKEVLRKILKDFDESFDWQSKLLFSEHHLSHAASAYYPSPYDEAVVLTMDGVGEWATTSVAIGRGSKLEVVKEISFPHSLGLLYSAFTYYIGFKVNSGEYKVMGLAPYGKPKYASIIREHLIDIKRDGSFKLNQAYFNYCTGLTMTNDAFSDLFGQPRRKPEQKLTQFHMDIAASVQQITEEVVLKIARGLAKNYGIPNLCLAGGVALNCVANGKLFREKAFANMWVQPAAGDAGGALGAALVGYHIHKGRERSKLVGSDRMKGSYLGPEFGQSEIEERLNKLGANFTSHNTDVLIEKTASALAENKAVGWMNGRMELGPRALGGRSILGNPQSPEMQRMLNLKVKYRESFRPFAPSIIREEVGEWFEHKEDSPYMLLVAEVKQERRKKITPEQESLFGLEKLNIVRSDIPAVTHVDYSARIQTVHAETNPLYHALISRFKQKTGCPILVNTSFNVRGEPIVSSPEDAFRCFMGTELDVLVVGNCILQKNDQSKSLVQDYKNKFDLD